MNITNQARDALIPVLQSQEAKGIRLYFIGFDPKDLNFGMSLEEPQPNDHIKVINQIPVAIEEGIEKYITDLVLEYENDRRGFVILSRQRC